ncbi:MAG: serine--tRNA ligase [Bacteroidales bacterium]
MIDINVIRASGPDVVERLKIKNFDASDIIKHLGCVDEARRKTMKSLEDILAESNALSRDIGQMMKQGKAAEAEELKERTVALKKESKKLQERLENFSSGQSELLIQLPNIPHPSVPKGTSSDDNKIIKQEGDIPSLAPGALPHWDLAREYGLVDFEMGNKITGAGFPVYRGMGAKLQRALISFFLDEAVAAGYTEYQPPLLVNEDSAFGTGQLPDKDAQMYFVVADQLFLIPTAEVPLTNMFRDVILDAGELPVKCVAYSSCFRREAGSYGKDVRGLNRLHQFDKVEIVQVAHPDKSYDVLEEMVVHVEGLLRKLELPFRRAMLCGGDMSFASAMTYDMEVYSTAQERWLEVSSISNFETFQSNRMKLRFRSGDGKNVLAHTLNGSALALPRIVAALLENNQTPDGIRIPKALVPYTGFEMIG